MRIENSLPSYQKLFGDLDFVEGDESRSVYSPAAYLADLLQLPADDSATAELRLFPSTASILWSKDRSPSAIAGLLVCWL